MPHELSFSIQNLGLQTEHISDSPLVWLPPSRPLLLQMLSYLCKPSFLYEALYSYTIYSGPVSLMKPF